MALVRMTMEEIDRIWTPERIKEYEKNIPETRDDDPDYEELADDAVLMSWTEFLEYEKRKEQTSTFYYKPTEELITSDLFVAEPETAKYGVR